MIGEAVSHSSSQPRQRSSKFVTNKLTMAMRDKVTALVATCPRKVTMVSMLLLPVLVLQIDNRPTIVICRVIMLVLAAMQHLVFVIKITKSFRVIKKVLDSDNSGSCLLF